MNIDKHSDTWKTLNEWAAAERQDAIENLIANITPEQQRGRIAQIDSLLGLARPSKDSPLVTDTYQ